VVCIHSLWEHTIAVPNRTNTKVKLVQNTDYCLREGLLTGYSGYIVSSNAFSESSKHLKAGH